MFKKSICGLEISRNLNPNEENKKNIPGPDIKLKNEV